MTTRRMAPLEPAQDATQDRQLEYTPPRRNFSYLRVSTSAQDTEKDKANVLLFVHQKNWEGGVTFIEDNASSRVPWRKRAIGPLVDQLESGDRLIIPEISRLGRSVVEIFELLSILQGKGVAIYDIRNGTELNGSLHSKVLAFAFGLAAEIERDLISKRTAEGIAAARKRGAVLGRPRGPGKSKLNPHRKEILEQLKLGVPLTTVAKRFGAATPTLLHWLKVRDLYPVAVDKTVVKTQEANL